MDRKPRMAIRIAKALKEARRWRKHHQGHKTDEDAEADFDAMIAWLAKR